MPLQHERAQQVGASQVSRHHCTAVMSAGNERSCSKLLWSIRTEVLLIGRDSSMVNADSKLEYPPVQAVMTGGLVCSCR